MDTGLSGDPVRDADGNPVSFSDVPNRSSCRKLCQDEPKCDYWVWKTKKNAGAPMTCWLKAGEGTTKEKADSIAGAKEGCDLSAIEDPDL